MALSAASPGPTLAAAIVVLVAFPDKQVGASQVIPVGVHTCAEPENIGSVQNFSVARVGSSFRAWLDLVIPWDTPVISKATVKLKQCPEGSTCKLFYTMRFNVGVCSLLVDKNSFWTPIFSHATPPVECPLKKTTYSIRNATVNVDNFLKLFDAVSSKARHNAVWTAKLEAFDDRVREFICLNIKVKYTQ